jgi:hypothetical protein
MVAHLADHPAHDISSFDLCDFNTPDNTSLSAPKSRRDRVATFSTTSQTSRPPTNHAVPATQPLGFSHRLFRTRPTLLATQCFPSTTARSRADRRGIFHSRDKYEESQSATLQGQRHDCQRPQPAASCATRTLSCRLVNLSSCQLEHLEAQDSAIHTTACG